MVVRGLGPLTIQFEDALLLLSLGALGHQFLVRHECLPGRLLPSCAPRPLVRKSSPGRRMRQDLHSRLAHSMETDDKLERLRHIAGKHGDDIIRILARDPESGRGWRVVKVSESGLEIIVGGPAEGMGATLDEVEAYLKTLPGAKPAKPA